MTLPLLVSGVRDESATCVPPHCKLTRARVTAQPATFRQRLARWRSDRLAWTATLLTVDNIGLSAIGGICTLIATRLWPAADVGATAAVIGAVNLVVIIAALGLPTAMVRFLGVERRQLLLLNQAFALAGTLAAACVLTIILVPGHLGVPIERLGMPLALLAGVLVVYVVSGVITTVGDPAWVARQEVSFLLAKDAAALAIRLVLLFALPHDSASSLLLVWLIYVAAAACIDLALLRLRLRRGGSETPDPEAPRRAFDPLRQHVSFAVGTYAAIVAATAPAFLMPTLCIALVGAKEAAYVAIALQVTYVLTVIPAQTSQALLSELARNPRNLAVTTARALSGA